jgi:hypothetical protein
MTRLASLLIGFFYFCEECWHSTVLSVIAAFDPKRTAKICWVHHQLAGGGALMRFNSFQWGNRMRLIIVCSLLRMPL